MATAETYRAAGNWSRVIELVDEHIWRMFERGESLERVIDSTVNEWGIQLVSRLLQDDRISCIVVHPTPDHVRAVFGRYIYQKAITS